MKARILSLALVIASIFTWLTPMVSYAEETNRNDVRANISADWDVVVWGDLINEADYARFVIAVSEAVASKNPAPLYEFFNDQLQAQLSKILQTAPEISQEVLTDLLLEAFQNDGASFVNGRLEIKAGIATYKRWERVIYDEPRTYKCKQKFPWGGWTWSICTTTERVEKEVPYPNNFQPYFAFRWLSGATSSVGGHQFYFKNDCHRPVRFALRYQQTSEEWITEGWWNFDANERSYLASDGVRIESNNGIAYFYAELSDGGQYYWSGDEYRDFDNRSLPMRKLNMEPDSDSDYVIFVTCPGI